MREIKVHSGSGPAVLELPGYSVNDSEHFVPVDQIVHFSAIDFNGLHGTEVLLSNGARVRTECWPQDLAKAIAASNALTDLAETCDPGSGAS